MIKPTVGRVVWFWPQADQSPIEGAQPLAALIAHVWSDACINLMVVSADGLPENYTSVPLHQGEGKRPETPFAEWMPFQVGQAKRHEGGEQTSAHKPSIGRVVHFRKGGQKPLPAIITDVHSDTCVDLAVFTTAQPASIGRTSVEQIDPEELHGVGWHWPPRA